jgi:hypothetical protein
VQTGTLDCVTAGYFARVVGMLLFRRTSEVMAFLQVGAMCSAELLPPVGIRTAIPVHYNHLQL